MAKGAKFRTVSKPVRLSIPASVANDLGALQDALGDLARRMGCPACCSGFDPLYLETARQFAIGDERVEPQPFRAIEVGGDHSPIDVIVPERVSNDIDMLKAAIAITVGQLGCMACCSGFDIAFRQESEMIRISQEEVESFAG